MSLISQVVDFLSVLSLIPFVLCANSRLPLMAKKLEEHLYRSARTKEDYIDPATLKFRLHLIAKGGILKPDDDEYGVEILDDSVGSVISKTSSGAQSLGIGTGKDLSNKIYSGTGMRNNRQAVPKANVSRGPENISPMAGNVGLPMNNMPLQRMSSQATGSSFSDTQDSRIPRQEKTDDIVIQQQRRLLLLRHASKCTSGPTCRTQHCSQMVSVWKHLKKCRDNSCKLSHCLSSRCILNHYRKCKREGNFTSCTICGPVILQSGEGIYNGAAGWRHDDTSADEFDKFVFGSEELTCTSEDMIGFPENVKIDGVVDDLYDSVMSQLGDIEPLDAFPIHKQNIAPTNIIQSLQQRSVGITDQQVGQSETLDILQTQSQPQLKIDSGCSILELQKELEQKQLLSQLIQQQKVIMFCTA